MLLNSSDIEEIVSMLATLDQKLGTVIKMVGPCKLERGAQGFPALVYSIIGQQLSNSSASAIRTRLEILLGNDGISPASILKTGVDSLRSVGMSWVKAQCLHSLAEPVLADEINFSKLELLEDEEVVKILTQVKGIGRWTAEMFLMFSLGRADVFPIDDQSIRSSMMRVYELSNENFRSQAKVISDNWRPYRTVASWYLYRYLDLNLT
jgi:DNA-3-methyladenine glycosylase II